MAQHLSVRAQRIIFVGDPNQLPPIGAGRPFVDLVRKLNQGINQFPIHCSYSVDEDATE
mgnify:CR=1 FL=1